MSEPLPPPGRCATCGGVLASAGERRALRCWLCELVAELVAAMKGGQVYAN